VAADLFETLMRFHREVAVPDMLRFHREVAIPDMQRLINESLEQELRAFRDETLTGFDTVYKRLGILETEMVLMRGAVRDLEKEVAGLKGQMASVEDRLSRIDEKVDHLALGSEMAEIKEEVELIQQRMTQLETLLNEH
jgi:predicted  nucleic acid-binding Zn-ribbon protein